MVRSSFNARPLAAPRRTAVECHNPTHALQQTTMQWRAFCKVRLSAKAKRPPTEAVSGRPWVCSATLAAAGSVGVSDSESRNTCHVKPHFRRSGGVGRQRDRWLIDADKVQPLGTHRAAGPSRPHPPHRPTPPAIPGTNGKQIGLIPAAIPAGLRDPKGHSMTSSAMTRRFRGTCSPSS